MAETLAELLVSMNIDAAQFFPAIEKLNKGMNDFAQNAKRQTQAANEEMGRAAAEAASVAEKYNALSATGGDSALAARLVSLKANFSREQAAAKGNADLQLKIAQKYDRDREQIDKEIAERRKRNASEAFGGSIGSEADKAGEGVGRLTEWFRGLRKEETEQQRMGKFLAGQISEIIPVSNVAAMSVGKLASGFALGAGIGVAVEGMKMLVGWYIEHAQEAKKAAEATRQHARATVAAVTDIEVSFRRFRENLQTPQTSAGSFITGQLDALDRERRELEVKFSTELDKRRKMRRELDEAMRATATGRADTPIDASSRAASAGAVSSYMATSSRAAEVAKANKELIEYERAAALVAAKRMAVEEQTPATIYAQHRKIDVDQTKELAALTTRYASDEVRIRKQADAQIADAKLNHAARAAEYEKAINHNAGEEITRAREQREIAHSQFVRQQSLVGATEEMRVRGETAAQVEALELKIRQAKRDGSAETKRIAEEELATTKETGRVKLALVEAEYQARRAMSTYQADQAKIDAEVAQMNSRADRWDVAKNLGAVGGDTGKAKRLATLEAELNGERIALEEAAKEHPELRAQIELAQTRLVQRGVEERAVILRDERAVVARALADTGGNLGRAKQIAAIEDALFAEKRYIAALLQEQRITEHAAKEATGKAEGDAAIAKYKTQAPQAAQAISALSQTAVSNLAEIGLGMQSVQQGFENAWRSMLSVAENVLAQMLERWLITKAAMSAADVVVPGTGSALGLGMGQPGFDLSMTGSQLPAARALGGPVSYGKTYLVGERGPELFTPNVSGAIVPNGQFGGGGGGTSVVLNVSTLDAASFDAYLAKNEAVLAKRLGRIAYKRGA